MEDCDAAPRVKGCALIFLSPAQHGVLEAGESYSFSLRVEGDAAALTGVTLTLAVANSSLPSWWTENLVCRSSAPVDGLLRVSYRLPRDLPLSDAYTLTARSVPAGLATASVALKVVRVPPATWSSPFPSWP